MTNENSENILQELAIVRGTGVVNMFDRIGVADTLYKLGYIESSMYILNNKNEYLNLLSRSANY